MVNLNCTFTVYENIGINLVFFYYMGNMIIDYIINIMTIRMSQKVID